VACETASFCRYLDTDPDSRAGFFAYLDERRARRADREEEEER